MSTTPHKAPASAPRTPELNRDADYWASWFWDDFLKNWLAKVQDCENGVFDALDVTGTPNLAATKSVLAQARTLFTLSHIALLSGDPAITKAARQQAEFLTRFCKAPGLYRCATLRDGSPTGQVDDEAARSYDQTFVILGLVTWNRLSPNPETIILIEECWNALQSELTDPVTGLLRNNDIGTDPLPAQNPHMHLYEACLQGYRMTKNPIWLLRAADLRERALQHFMDQDSGSIAEFLTSDLQPLSGDDGYRREIGHQCEWAWLLLEEAELANLPALKTIAERLISFADKHGFSAEGWAKGAAYDAVSAKGGVTENSFLLWPQTEAIKTLALRHSTGDLQAGERACALMCLMFESWFEGRSMFVNQLNANGDDLWSEALTRLMYHLALAMTEGARAGLWPEVSRHS